jgi:heptosyltransferase-2
MPQPSASPKRIVIRGLNWLGDAVMSTPALRRLREAHPEAFIALLTPAKLADLWTRHPDINAVMQFAARDSVFAIARQLRREQFDTAIVFPNSPRSALETFLARVPRRIGLARPWRNFLLTDVIRPQTSEVPMRKKTRTDIQRAVTKFPQATRETYSASGHHMFRYLHIAAALGAIPEPAAPRLIVMDVEVDEAIARFGECQGRTGLHRPLIGFNAGAEYGPAKRWPVEHFIETARRLHQQADCACWILGGPGDRELAQSFAGTLRKTGIDARSLAGETTLRQLCAAMKACDVVVTNDTGPMHVAAAVGTPVVVPFGSTSPELTGPGLPGDKTHCLLSGNAPCAPCFRRECPIDLRCLHNVSVEDVVGAVVQILRTRSPSSG